MIKVQWSNWGVGGKIIFLSTCTAAVSFLLPWVDIGFVSRNGITQGSVLIGLLFIYPILNLLKNKKINKVLGILCGALSALITIAYISSKSIELFGETRNVSSFGAHLFLLASLALIIGVMKYNKIEDEIIN